MSDPTTLGRYQIEAFLGKGAFAEVYKAKDTVLKRTVALKVLKPALMADEEAFTRFKHEAQVLAGLDHPRIAWVWDMGETDGRYFIAMRYVDGRSLDKVILERGQLTWDETLLVIDQMGEALQYAHDKGLVHRDVKPQNILISEKDGILQGAVLTDFGLVKAMQSSGMTTSGSFMGTPNYMAAEIWEGKEVTPASDQYALACVTVEMLTGKVLFDGNTPPAVMAKHFQSPSLPTELADPVRSTLIRALGMKSDERFTNIQAFVNALHEPGNKEKESSVDKSARKKDEVLEKKKNKKPVKENSSSLKKKNEIVLKLVDQIEMTFMRIPAGDFVMGTGTGWFSDYGPKHIVYLEEYWMGRTPVTNAQYSLFVKTTGHSKPGNWKSGKIPKGREEHPVVNISLDDILAFCEWVTQVSGEAVRLPSEAEWEKAARGIDERKYPWGNEQPDVDLCNFNNNIEDTSLVGFYSPAGNSPFGCVDMAGNVWECTTSLFKKYPYRKNDGREDESIYSARVLRGGSWNEDDDAVCSYYRGYLEQDLVDVDLGFRCCCELSDRKGRK